MEKATGEVYNYVVSFGVKTGFRIWKEIVCTVKFNYFIDCHE